MATAGWPALRDKDRWLPEGMERRLRESRQSPEEMRARAHELRVEAQRSDVKGIRDAKLALAAQYDQAALSCLMVATAAYGFSKRQTKKYTAIRCIHARERSGVDSAVLRAGCC
jgi:hypothetical protein